MSSKIYLVGEYAVASPEEAVRLALQGDKFVNHHVRIWEYGDCYLYARSQWFRMLHF